MNALSRMLVLTFIIMNIRSAIAMCKPGGGWEALGTTEYDVCMVAQYLLLSHCSSSSQSVPDLPISTSWYKASNFSGAHTCVCSKVMYNLLSACAGCQKWNVSYGINQYWQSLADYEGETCVKYHSTDGRIQIQPDSGDQEWSKVAPWSSTVSDTNFNLTQALAIAAISKPTATPTSSTAPARPNLHIGAIVGGTPGGLFFLTIDLGLLVYLHRRKRHNTPEIESSEGYLQPKQATSSSFHPATRSTKPFGLYENNMVDDSDPSMTSRGSPWDEAVIATQQRIGELDEERKRHLPAAEETRNAPTDTNNKR